MWILGLNGLSIREKGHRKRIFLKRSAESIF